MKKEQEVMTGNPQAGAAQLIRVSDPATGEKFLVIQIHGQDNNKICHLALSCKEAAELCDNLADAIEKTWGVFEAVEQEDAG